MWHCLRLLRFVSNRVNVRCFCFPRSFLVGPLFGDVNSSVLAPCHRLFCVLFLWSFLVLVVYLAGVASWNGIRRDAGSFIRMGLSSLPQSMQFYAQSS